MTIRGHRLRAILGGDPARQIIVGPMKEARLLLGGLQSNRSCIEPPLASPHRPPYPQDGLARLSVVEDKNVFGAQLGVY
eukprot:scaffold216480_cov40-Tisochrysis_lutea.AAC.1